MSPRPGHVWSCGQCGARVSAAVGGIVRAFQAHLVTCPALARRRPVPPARASGAPRAGGVGAAP
jgi:hypothetical protein